MFAQWLLPCEAKQPELVAPNFFILSSLLLFMVLTVKGELKYIYLVFMYFETDNIIWLLE
jgi:hypothetical protein